MVCLQKYYCFEKDSIDAIHADEIITSSWIVWMKYCSNESWSKVIARIGNWNIRHEQYLKRQIVDIKGKKPSGWRIRNKFATIITNRSSGFEHKRRYLRAARISGKRSANAWTKELNKSCAGKVKGTEDEVDLETERPRWTERSASNVEPAVQANPVQRSSRCDRKQRHGVTASRGMGGSRQ